MDEFEREVSSAEKNLELGWIDVPPSEIGDTGADMTELGVGHTVETEVSLNGSIIKLSSDKTRVVLHEDARFSNYDHVIAHGLVIDPDTGVTQTGLVTIFPPRYDSVDDSEYTEDRFSYFDKIVCNLEQLGFPISTFSREPSAEAAELYYRQLRGIEEIDDVIANIIKQAGE